MMAIALMIIIARAMMRVITDGVCWMRRKATVDG